MMKKRTVILFLCGISALLLLSCGREKAEETAGIPAQGSDGDAQAGEDGPDGDMRAGEDGFGDTGGDVREDSLVNPMEEIEDMTALQDQMGFIMLALPQTYCREEDCDYYIIDKTLAEIQCGVGEYEVTIRQQKGSGDISGVYGADLKDGEYKEIPYHCAEADGLWSAWWEYKEYAYSVTVEGIGEADFISQYVQVLVDQSIFNYSYVVPGEQE